MCGIVGLYSNEPVNQRVYDSLLLVQHRGQDAAGIATLDGLKFNQFKAKGLVTDAIRTRNMRDLVGNMGVGQCRAQAQRFMHIDEEYQPYYAGAPYGIAFVSDGNVYNFDELVQDLYDNGRFHVNTNTSTELLMSVLADEILRAMNVAGTFSPEILFTAVSQVFKRCRGGYSCIALIAGKGMLAFRDPNGIRPICFGKKEIEGQRPEYLFASESVVMEGQEFPFERDLMPGEAIFVDMKGEMHTKICAEETKLNVCAFEFVYTARPDSVIDGISVYGARLKMGETLAREVARQIPLDEIDVVMPIPDSGRPTAQQLAFALNLPYREGYIKNRYIGRTFIIPGQAVRKKTVRQKLNAMSVEFKGKRVLLVDDSIVRGTTMMEIVRMTYQAGASKVYVASGAPRVMYPNVYGIDMATRAELVCGDGKKDGPEVAKILGCDHVVYQTVEGMKEALFELQPNAHDFEDSCFTGRYITEGVTPEYLADLEAKALEAKRIQKERKKA